MDAPTYESTLSHYGLVDSQLNVICDESVLRRLAPKFNRWRELSVYLKLETSVADSIDASERWNEEGKRYRLLKRWTEIYGHKATYRQLVRCFIEAERADLAGIVCEAYIKETTSFAAELESARTDPDGHVTPNPLSSETHTISTSQLEQVLKRETDLQKLEKKLILYHITVVTLLATLALYNTGMLTPIIEAGKHYIPPPDEVNTPHLRPQPIYRYDEAESSTDEEQTHWDGDHLGPPTTFSEIYKQFRSHFEVEDKVLSEYQKTRKAIMKELMASTAANKEDWERKMSEASRARLQLREEQKKQQTLLKNSQQIEEKIKWLEEGVYQKLRLKERLEEQEKCEQVTELETQFQHSLAKLEREKKAKDNITIESDKAFHRITALQKGLEKTNRELKLKSKERKNHQHVVKCFQLVEDQLKLTLEQQKEIIVNHRIVEVVLFFIIIVLVSLLIFFRD